MSQKAVTESQVYDALKKCMDPEIPVNVVDLGLIYGIKVASGTGPGRNRKCAWFGSSAQA